jgi:Zn-finger in ubiquitin-hydrolases and other protein
MDRLRRFAFQRSFKKRTCHHLDRVEITDPAAPECPACLDAGAKWVHVRMCLTCGLPGCCDTSKLKHARGHHLETGHPLMRSVEPGETWGWCYLDEAFLTQSDYLTGNS